MANSKCGIVLLGLNEPIAHPKHTFRFQWQAGSLAILNNRATSHRAINDYPGRWRLLHRITPEGDVIGA